MAKKRRIVEKAPEEEYEFVPPEFDEKEFILKDFYGTKVVLVVAVIAVVFGIICAVIQKALNNFWLALAVLFVGAFVQKPLLKLCKFDPELLESKTMVGNIFLYLLFGLGIWILGVNPPFI